MAKRASRRGRTAVPPLKFDQKLVLNQWLLRLFNCPNFDKLAQDLKDHRPEGLNEDNISRFCVQLTNRTYENEELPKDLMVAYDQNIVRHTEKISARRSEPIRWKYFQYLTLLFVEIYLDRYFTNPKRLLADLNKHVEAFNREKPARDQIEPYQEDDLRKLALWNATGSGKTLLMHVNILQYKHYLEEHDRSDELNRVLLLTPNEGLSRQHDGEFEASGFLAELFNKDQYGLFAGQMDVEIIDIHKLAEEMGEKTVAIDAFEGNNLVLVDEGHRGSSGDEWMARRNRLCEEGFSFEYSATFGQAVRAASGQRGKDLEQEYGKCILFDYSYKYFYKDGFGKEYQILNLQDDSDDEIRQKYLTACLMTFYQQLKVYQDENRELRPFLLEKPLSVFVGGSVNAVRTERGRKVSDVLDVLLVLAEFVGNQQQSIQTIQQLLAGRAGLLDEQGRDIFADSFLYLRKLEMTPEAIFADVLQSLFHANARAKLHVELLKGAEGEIALRLGENDWFGVINVGDASKLHKLCEDHDELVTTNREFGGSLFRDINNNDSTINVLIGSKKFTEGWNSWRVSTMGLMNIGRSEGSQIIQLFGRGVRLKGHGMSLKRSQFVPDIDRPKFIQVLETLNIFGVRADYMQRFREYLKEEGVPSDDDRKRIILPVKKNLPPDKKLKVLDVPEGVDYKRQAPKPTLDPLSKYLRKHPVILNWYPKIQTRRSEGIRSSTELAQLHQGKLNEEHLAFMDMDRVYFETQRFKNERAWFNLNLPRDRVDSLLARSDWYRLYIPEDQLAFTNFGRVRQWQEIAVALTKKYLERWYKHQKATWENERLEYQELSEDRFPDQYRLDIDMAEMEIIEELEEIRDFINAGKLAEIEVKRQNNVYQAIGPIVFDCHLFHPLVYLKNSVIRVSPVKLEQSETDFVLDLMKYYRENTGEFANREMYLLRNESRGRGVGFFQDGGFYPDFILWLVDGDRQYITFVDPHGLRHAEGKNDRKIQMFNTVKRLGEERGDPNIILDSYIVTPTDHAKIQWFGDDDELMTKAEFAENHVLFQYDDRNTYIEKLLGMIVPTV